VLHGLVIDHELFILYIHSWPVLRPTDCEGAQTGGRDTRPASRPGVCGDEEEINTPRCPVDVGQTLISLTGFTLMKVQDTE